MTIDPSPQFSKVIPEGYVLHRADTKDSLHVSEDGESGAGAYLTDVREVADRYAKAKQSYRPEARVRTYTTTKPLTMFDRTTDEGERRFNDLQYNESNPRIRLKGQDFVAKFASHGYEGVIYPNSGKPSREVTVHDPSHLRMKDD